MAIQRRKRHLVKVNQAQAAHTRTEQHERGPTADATRADDNHKAIPNRVHALFAQECIVAAQLLTNERFVIHILTHRRMRWRGHMRKWRVRRMTRCFLFESAAPALSHTLLVSKKCSDRQ